MTIKVSEAREDDNEPTVPVVQWPSAIWRPVAWLKGVTVTDHQGNQSDIRGQFKE